MCESLLLKSYIIKAIYVLPLIRGRLSLNVNVTWTTFSIGPGEEPAISSYIILHLD